MEREKFKILLIFLFLGVILLFFIFTFYYQKNINFKIQEVFNIEEEKNIIQRDIEKSLTFKKRESLEKDAIEKIGKVFLDIRAPIDFLSFLEEISRKCNVELEVALFSEGKEQELKANSLSFRIKTIGNFQNTFCFLVEIELSPFLIKMERITFSSKKEEKSIQGIFEFKLYGKET